jgi:putative ABC transport system permease protein
MLLNYLKIAIRNIRRSASYTLINVSGLALGITCSLLIFSLINYHLDFDNFHNNPDRVYRFVTEQHRDQVSYAAAVPPAFVVAFRNDYTFGEKAARICTLTEELITVEHNGATTKFREEVSFAEPEFFEIFNFPLITASKTGLLTEPNTAIISERIAKKYFGSESPIDKIIRFDNRIDLRITGVLKNIPDNTDLRSGIYFSYSTIKQYNEWYYADDAWGGITGSIQSFVRLQPGITPAEVEQVLPAYVKKYRAESKNVHHYKLQPLSDWHFNPKYSGKMSKGSLLGLSIVGFVLIFTACLNFINLATAQAITRSREVGVRKTLGSARIQLFWQFTTETAVIVLLALVVALCVCSAVLPYINELFSTRISTHLFTDLRLLSFSLVLFVAVTFLSASYPGIILSGFKPVLALKGKLSSRSAGSFNVRRVLITTQFVIAQVLLIGLIVFIYQTRYFENTDMGFDQDAIVMIPIGSDDAKMTTLKNQFMAMPQVEHVSLCFAAPASQNNWGTSLTFDNRSESEVFSASFKSADEHYLSTFGIDLVAGRNLTPSDSAREFLVNEAMVRQLNSSPEEILGKNISSNGGDYSGPIVGVISDFHDQSFRAAISPVFITTSPDNYNEYAVKINMADAANTLASLEKLWSSMYPELIYDYDFLDTQTAQFYQAEKTVLLLVQVFAFISLFIGCIGLYGLVSFMAVQKTKEIGIRKVLGGDVAQILWIFGKEFSRLVLIAFLLAAPVGWFLMSRWLETYEYKVSITPWVFVLELAVIFTIVLFTVGYQSLKTALMNPVNSLRAE